VVGAVVGDNARGYHLKSCSCLVMFLGKSSHVFMTAPTGAALRSDGPVPFEPDPSLEVEPWRRMA
jgi:hypothetical protein